MTDPIPSPAPGVEARRDPVDAQCLDCGLDYAAFGLDLLLPRAQWLLIHPSDGGLLCARCLVVRAANVSGATAIHAVIEIAPS